MFLVSVKRLWDKAQHNAFTDLVRFQERWWCVFREGEKHVSPDGALRVITSSDGETWESAALLQSATEDLRDGKLSVTSDGRLLLIGAAHRPPPGVIIRPMLGSLKTATTGRLPSPSANAIIGCGEWCGMKV